MNDVFDAIEPDIFTSLDFKKAQDIFDRLTSSFPSIFKSYEKKERPLTLNEILYIIRHEMMLNPPVQKVVERIIQKEIVREPVKLEVIQPEGINLDPTEPLKDQIKTLEEQIKRIQEILPAAFMPKYPLQDGNGGKALLTDGSKVYWGTVGGNPTYIGDPVTASWRFYDDGTNLIVQHLEGGQWVEKSSFLA